MKLAFIFPGQGSQKVGMGLEIAGKFPCVREIYDKADEVLGFSISKLIKEGPVEKLKQTVNTQPAVVVTSIAFLEVLREKGLDCEITAGHSVGEFTALYCAGVLSFEDCLKVTRARGEYMQEAGIRHPGTMSAIIGLEVPAIEGICEKAGKSGVVVVANLNCPGQVVISGSIESVKEVGNIAIEQGAKKVIPLAVSAAFHSPLMDEAAGKLAQKLDEVKFLDARIPVVSNVSAEPVTNGEEIRDLMKKQISSRVMWEKSIKKMQSLGIETFIEIGPGKALSGMMRRIDRKAPMLNLEDIKSYENLINKLNLTPV
ncbi:MAG: ACP S-malonyltransferase [Candidatus Eremiobacteraeota bacterium]|nr:ACP S-malonyltransferase [Candidatus Eremiobacteraeota bacterium]